MDADAPAGALTPSPPALRVVAAEAARAAGELLRARFVNRADLVVRTKSSPTDLVSEADDAAEAAIRAVLGSRRPDDAILGEEGGLTSGASDALRWIVDPLDGTTNFLYGLPAWCVSVAVQDADGGVAGVVFDPLRDEIFAAERGGPATLNGEPLLRTDAPALATSLVGTGFGYESALRARQAGVVAAVLPQVRDVRRVGACALDLAWLAAGRLDGFYERGVQAWDIAAGTLICARAGVVVEELAAVDGLPSGVLAAPASLVGDLRALVT